MKDSLNTSQRHSALIRITHWINAAAFIALLMSGIAILLAYPRLHWGETGSIHTEAWLDLPLPFVLELGIRGPGRSIHFFAAWVVLFNGIVYLLSGLLTRHFTKNLVPALSELKPASLARALAHPHPSADTAEHYNLIQRLVYLVVIFGLIPFMFLTGLAMSPSVTSVVPFIVEMFGGHQSARTLHFFAANALLIFFLVHLTMVVLTGFGRQVRAMITGYRTSQASK